MTNDDPWSGIEVPPARTSRINARRVAANTRWNLYWAVDSDHQVLLILQHGAGVRRPRRLPRFRGLRVEAQPADGGTDERIVIRLTDREQRDIFLRFCRDVVEATVLATTEEQAIDRFLARTWRWHRLLQGSRDSRLGDEEQKGLIGELVVLERHVFPVLGALDAVRCWTGPLGAPRDFEVSRVHVEAKVRSASAPRVAISSENQLESAGNGAIFLHVTEVTIAAEGAAGAVTVTEMASGIRSTMAGHDMAAVELFEARLEAVGFDWAEDYNNGITATAEEIEIEDDGGRLLLRRPRNFQIVNGGQTTASLHAARRSRVDVSPTFVQMKLSVVDSERASRLVPKISEFANSQNRVNAADFFANHPFHVRIEEFSRRIYAPSPDGTFRQSKWFYERARGQYADARAGLTTAERRKFDLENPRRQLFTKTDLAKFLNVWEERPHEVSLGAQKNFAAFARRIGQAWTKAPDDFNEAWYREAVAKAIVFRSTERIVGEQPWYQGGYRANIVAHAIAKTAHDLRERGRAVNFEDIWRRQATGPALETALATVAESVHGVLVDPPPGISNVTEWAKKQACWKRVRDLDVSWPRPFLDDLLSGEERQDAARVARREQRVLNGVEAQIAVVNAGAGFWADALAWGREPGAAHPGGGWCARRCGEARGKDADRAAGREGGRSPEQVAGGRVCGRVPAGGVKGRSWITAGLGIGRGSRMSGAHPDPAGACRS